MTSCVPVFLEKHQEFRKCQKCTSDISCINMLEEQLREDYTEFRNV